MVRMTFAVTIVKYIYSGVKVLVTTKNNRQKKKMLLSVCFTCVDKKIKFLIY